MQTKYFVLFGLIAIKFILQYVLIHPVYELQRDEYLHLDQGLQRMAHQADVGAAEDLPDRAHHVPGDEQRERHDQA